MENVTEYPTATLESVWAAFRESDRQRKESEEKFNREMAESNAKFEREKAESNARFEREKAESNARFEQSRAEFDRRMKNLGEMIGGVSNSNGTFAEDFFLNTISTGDKRLFGEHFDQCYSLLKRYHKENQEKSEHDILLVNGKAVAIVEVKYRARKEDVQKIVNRLPRFRSLYPEYKDHRVYLGLAAMSFDRGVEKESAKEGVAIVKQVGEIVVINDERLKAY